MSFFNGLMGFSLAAHEGYARDIILPSTSLDFYSTLERNQQDGSAWPLYGGQCIYKHLVLARQPNVVYTRNFIFSPSSIVEVTIGAMPILGMF